MLPCFLMFGACSKEVIYVTNIEQTEKTGSTTYYTVTYSNGTKQTLTIKDGENGEDLTIEAIAKYCEANGEDFDQFLAKFLTITAPNNTEKAINKALQSAVSIYSPFYTANGYSISCGAGVIYQIDGDSTYIVTNYHVVYNKNTLSLNKISTDINLFQYGTSENIDVVKTNKTGYYSSYTFDKGAVKCEYIGGSMTYDIAVLKVKTADLIAVNENFSAVSIAEKYSAGEEAIAIGNPEGEGIAVTTGVVSVESEYIDLRAADEQTIVNYRVMRIDTAVNGGNSGGGLFNNDAELIGIVNAKTTAYNIDNIAYALPVDNITKVANNIIYNHKQNPSNKTLQAITGITCEATNARQIYNPTTGIITLYDDAKITSIKSTSPLLAILKTGDIVTHAEIINEQGTTSVHFKRHFELNELLLTLKVGDKLKLEGTRSGLNTTFGTITVTSENIQTIG